MTLGESSLIVGRPDHNVGRPDYRNACVDSYRALVLKPDWEKPYYRCSEGWMLLGNHTTALQVNGMGCELCTSTSDLLRQKGEIMVAMAR